MENIRIAILSKSNAVVGYLDNDAPEALHYYDDVLHNYLTGSTSTFSFTTSTNTNEWFAKLKVGNKLAFRYANVDYFFNIVKTEQTENELSVEAMSACLELINEECTEYPPEGTEKSAKTFEEYLAIFDPSGALEIGKNEIADYTRTCSWDGEDTQLERIYSLASKFDAEVEFRPVLNSDYTLEKLVINVYHEHDDDHQGIGTDRTNGQRIRYGYGLDGITKASDITELYTAILATGEDGLTTYGYTPTGEDWTQTDSDGNVLYSKPLNSAYMYADSAMQKFPSQTTGSGDKAILYRWETDYTTKEKLFAKALSKLKKISKPQVTYEIDSTYSGGKIGDTVVVIDEEFEPAMYLEARIAEQEISFTDPTQNVTTFSNVEELQAVTTAEIQAQISTAKSIAVKAQATATTAKASADTATAKASEAQTTAESAQTAAESAQTTAESAQSTAETAQTTATNAQTTANTAKTTATAAKTTATNAQTTANTAKSTADTAKSTADATATDLATNYSTTADTNDAIATAKTEAVSTAEASAKAYTEEKVSAVSNYFWHDADGAHVSDTAGAVSGKNVLLTSDGMSIRDGSAELATFRESEILLGQNSNASNIKLLNGRIDIGLDTSSSDPAYIKGSIDLSLLSNANISIKSDEDTYIKASELGLEASNIILRNVGSIYLSGYDLNVSPNSNEKLKYNSSPILTESDVSSTYSATGTAPVNGVAVASAIPTADIDANTAARHTHANQSVLDGIGTANVGNWNTAYTNARYLTNSSVLKGITADMVSSWNGAFQDRTDTPTDADNAPMGMCTVSGKTCANLPDTTNQYWLFTFFNANQNGIQFAKRTNLNFILYMRTKNNSGTSAWKSITFA